MKLIFLLILGLLNLFEGKQYTVLGRISSDEKQKTSKNNFCVYVDTSEFENESEIPIKVTVYSGSFEDSVLYYGSSDAEPALGSDVNLDSRKNSDSHDCEGLETWGFYIYYYFYTDLYNVPKPNKRYLIIGIPEFSGHFDYYVEIEASKLFPLWLKIVLIIAGIVLLVLLIKLFLYCYKKKRSSKEDNGPSDLGIAE